MGASVAQMSASEQDTEWLRGQVHETADGKPHADLAVLVAWIERETRDADSPPSHSSTTP